MQKKFNDLLLMLPTDILNPKLNLQRLINKATNLSGTKKYSYAVTIQGKYRIAFYFDDGNSNPETNNPTSLTLFYIGNYH